MPDNGVMLGNLRNPASVRYEYDAGDSEPTSCISEVNNDWVDNKVQYAAEPQSHCIRSGDHVSHDVKRWTLERWTTLVPANSYD